MNETSTEAHRILLDADLNHPETLDQIWSAYMETKNVHFVMKIVSVLDWRDRVREHLEAWLQQTSSTEYFEYHQRLADWMFPIDYDNRTIEKPLDLDLHVALLAKNGQLKFDELPVQLSREVLICLSMKSAALWSLVSISKDDIQVSEICKREALKKGGVARTHLV